MLVRPLLKLVDKLLLVGILHDDDITRLLIMIDPQTWDPDFEPGKGACLQHYFKTPFIILMFGS